MYGLFPALMESNRFRAAEEQRAAEMAMRQQDQQMRRDEFGMRKREFDQRQAEAARARQFQDELVNSIDADGTPMVGAQPGDAAMRMPELSVDGPSSNMPMTGAAPAPQPGTGLSKLDRAAMRSAAASGDLKSMYGVKDRVKAESQSTARKTEFKRLMALSEQDLVGAFEPMNAHPGFKGMLNFDPKSKQFLLVSQIPGLETQAMTKEELVNSMMGIWEAGNGDFEKGMGRMMAGAQRRREIDNSNFDRSGKLAGLNADAYFKDRAASATDAQRAEQSRHNRAMEGTTAAGLGLQRERMSQEDWSLVGVAPDNKGLLRFNKRTGKTEVQALPEGTDATGLFRRITGQGGGQMTPQQQLEMRAKLKTAGYDDAAIEQLVTGYDPIEAMRAKLESMRQPKPAANTSAATPRPEPGFGGSENERLWRAGGGPASEQAATARAAAEKQRREAVARASADPEVQQIRAAVAAAARGTGPAVDRRAAEAKIAEILKARYGVE